MNTILFYPKPKHAVFLIDGSGSMEPAWSEAWSSLFNMLKNQDSSFSILLFKQPRYLTETEAEALLATDDKYYAIVDVAALLREQNLVRIRRVPDPQEIGVRFKGRTPLLAAIYWTIRLARANYPKADIEVYVVSDNRDSMVLNYNDYEYSDAQIITNKELFKVKVALIPVGNFLRKYTQKYDAVLSANHSSIASLISLI